jgi:hypothetical protein
MSLSKHELVDGRDRAFALETSAWPPNYKVMMLPLFLAFFRGAIRAGRIHAGC